MKARVPLITLGVDDLERAVRFYRDGLGEHGAVAFFELEGGLKLALWPRKSLAHDAGIALGRAKLERVSPLHTTFRSKAEASRPQRAPSTAVMPATSRIPTAICGRWRGIRTGNDVGSAYDGSSCSPTAGLPGSSSSPLCRPLRNTGCPTSPRPRRRKRSTRWSSSRYSP